MRVADTSSSEDLSLLIFSFETGQYFGINLLKVREVASSPTIVRIADMPRPIAGVCRLRGETVVVIDMKQALGLGRADQPPLVMICHYARQTVGFLVEAVHDILNLPWSDVELPPKELAAGEILTGIVNHKQGLIQIPDLEQILAELLPPKTGGNDSPVIQASVLIVDDSHSARRQIGNTLTRLGVECIMAKDGEEALKLLEHYDASIDAMIIDVEMPRLDGYSLVKQLRESPNYCQTPILLHSSLEGVANEQRGYAAGANNVLVKFDADALTANLEQLIHLKPTD